MPPAVGCSQPIQQVRATKWCGIHMRSLGGSPAALQRQAPCRRPPAAPCNQLWQRKRQRRQPTHGIASSSSSTAAATENASHAALEAGDQSSAAVAGEPLKLTVSLASGMQFIGQEEWDACATGGGEVNPFVLHDFLHVLEASGSAVREEGWLGQHLVVRRSDGGELLGCCPMYLKAHSYGEYVFDQSWANAYHRMLGQPYYPKLVVGVPFTPVPGPRLLVKPGPQAGAVRRAMADSLKQIADQFGVSSLAINFASQQECEELGGMGYLPRTGIQYHWYNGTASKSLLASVGSTDSEDGSDAEARAGTAALYSSFDDAGDETSFMMALRQSKRKSIRQERRKAAQAGLRFVRLAGSDIKPTHWDTFYSCYRNTTDRKWGQAYLTREFFHLLGERLGDRVLLVLAETDEGAPGQGRPVAGALNLIGSHAIFGRNWGCLLGDRIPNLHFELCYYQALEAAIERGLQRVEAGAQGEHKLQRGYVPSLTHSLHYLPNPGFAGVVARYLQQERAEIEYTMEILRREASPYKESL